MGLILNIATILGGLAALWFFLERFLAFRRINSGEIGQKQKSVSNRARKRSLPILEMVVAAILCGIGGLVVGVVFMKYSSGAILLTLVFGFVSFFVGASLKIGVIELSAAFMTSWTIIGIIVFVPIESLSGVPFAESSTGTI